MVLKRIQGGTNAGEFVYQARSRGAGGGAPQGAKRHHRSLQGELIAILEEALHFRRFTVKEACRKIRELGIETGDETTAIVREERDAC